MFCKHCGKEVHDNAVICVHCGCSLVEHRQSSGFENSGNSSKDRLTTLLLCLFLGSLGVHRFYVGKPLTGILMLFTMGMLGVMTLIDLIMILMGSFTDGDGNII